VPDDGRILAKARHQDKAAGRPTSGRPAALSHRCKDSRPYFGIAFTASKAGRLVKPGPRIDQPYFSSSGLMPGMAA
jgi:hypothetical protein